MVTISGKNADKFARKMLRTERKMIKVINTNNKLMKKPQIKMPNIKIPKGGYSQRDIWIRKDIINKIIEDYIEMQEKYGMDFCPTLFINHIKKLGEELP